VREKEIEERGRSALDEWRKSQLDDTTSHGVTENSRSGDGPPSGESKIDRYVFAGLILEGRSKEDEQARREYAFVGSTDSESAKKLMNRRHTQTDGDRQQVRNKKRPFKALTDGKLTSDQMPKPDDLFSPTKEESAVDFLEDPTRWTFQNGHRHSPSRHLTKELVMSSPFQGTFRKAEQFRRRLSIHTRRDL